MNNYEEIIKAIRRELEDYVVKNKLKSLVLGISGGMDSCLCAALAKPVCDKLGIPLFGASLPSESNENEEIDRAERTLAAFCHKQNTFYIDAFYLSLKGINKIQFIPEINDCNKSFEELNTFTKEEQERIIKAYKIRNGNIKARIRMIYLYNLASMWNGLVLSTDNYTEYLLGFWTIHGDVGDYGMIQELWKTEVYEMAEYMAEHEYLGTEHADILKETVNAQATDGLGVTNTGDLGQILPEWVGTSRDGYMQVDQKLKTWLLLWKEAAKTPKVIKAMDKMSKDPVISRHINSEFKRKNPVNINRNLLIS